MANDKRKSSQVMSSQWWSETAMNDECHEIEDLSPEQLSKLIRELRDHQLELKSQNEELRRTVKELQVSQADHFEIFKTTNSALFIHDVANGKIIEVNPAMCKMYGVTPDEVQNMGIFDFSSGEPGYTQEDADHQMAKAIQQGHNRFEWHAKKKSGKQFWVEVYLHRVRLSGQDRVMAVVKDITERKEAEKALFDNDRKLSSAMQIAKLGYWEYDVSNKTFTFDDHFYDIFHTTAEEVGGYSMSVESYTERFVYPDDACVVAEEAQKAIETKDPNYSSQLEHRIIYADGGVGHIAVRLFVVKDEQGRTIKTYGANQDVTERRQAEEALRDERNFAESVIETAQAIVLVLDPKGRIVRINRYLEELSGYTMAEVQGKDWFETFLPSREQQKIKTLFAESISEHPTRGNVNFIVTKNGNERLIEWHDRTLLGSEGNIIALVAVGQDITERIQAEEALRRAHDELEKRVEERTKELVTVNAKLRNEMAERRRVEEREKQLEANLAHVGRLTTMGEMASSLAHELNQPLGAIVLHAEVLSTKIQDDIQDAPDLIESATAIADQAHRAGDLIRRMRQFAKHATPKRAELALAEALTEVIALGKREIRDAGITLHAELDPSLPKVFADKILLQQVLLNLMQNAIEAMESTEREARRLDVQARVDNGCLEISIGDTGCGIPAEKIGQADDLFDTFYSTKSDGLGMGLAIVRTIVESHGGYIWATPNPDRGTIFTFTIPLAAENR